MNQQLVVAQLIPELNNGGVERGTIEVANYLAENNFVSIVISAGGRLLNKLNPNVIHIHLEIGKKSVFVFNLIKPLRKLITQHNISIVHARSRLPAWIAYKAISRMKGNKPSFITTIHGLYSVKRYSSIMARADHVIAVSETAKNYVIDNYSQFLKGTLSLIYRGIDPKEFPYNFKPSTEWLEDWNIKHPKLANKKIVLLPGRLTSLKGAKDLLFWLKNISDDSKLVLTSDINSNEYSLQLYSFFKQHNVTNKIEWIGIQSSMAEVYAISDLVISSSKRPESFGRTVLEALAIGTPVVAYNHGGVGEILDALYPAGKVASGDYKMLSDSINNHLQKAASIPNNNPFLLSTMLEKTLNVYKNSLKHES
jgi:glycosyltransferase involved in cell wall biosynthesis